MIIDPVRYYFLIVFQDTGSKKIMYKWKVLHRTLKIPRFGTYDEIPWECLGVPQGLGETQYLDR